MENQIDIDESARRANASGGAVEVLNKLFGAAYALPKWLFNGARRTAEQQSVYRR